MDANVADVERAAFGRRCWWRHHAALVLAVEALLPAGEGAYSRSTRGRNVLPHSAQRTTSDGVGGCGAVEAVSPRSSIGDRRAAAEVIDACPDIRTPDVRPLPAAMRCTMQRCAAHRQENAPEAGSAVVGCTEALARFGVGSGKGSSGFHRRGGRPGSCWISAYRPSSPPCTRSPTPAARRRASSPSPARK